MTKYEKHGALHVNKKGRLVDHLGEEVALHGFSSHGLSWYPEYMNRDTFEFMKNNWHIDIVRLAMYTDELDGYCVGDEANKQKLLEVIDRGVKAATELGLYIIIDWHILADSNPLINKDEAVKFFDYVSDKYKAYGNVFYEICNEPNVNCTWEDIKEYAQEVIPVIRRNDKYAVILVGTPSWSQKVNQALANPITIDDNLMYVLHFYADTHRDELRGIFRGAAEAGLPLFISEFGCCDASGRGDNNFEEAEKWIALADEFNTSFILWSLANRDETCATFVPTCNKLTDFEDEDIKPACKWYIGILDKHKDIAEEKK